MVSPVSVCSHFGIPSTQPKKPTLPPVILEKIFSCLESLERFPLAAGLARHCITQANIGKRSSTFKSAFLWTQLIGHESSISYQKLLAYRTSNPSYENIFLRLSRASLPTLTFFDFSHSKIDMKTLEEIADAARQAGLSIQHLNLRGCSSLVGPLNLSKFPQLQTLDISECTKITELSGLNCLGRLEVLKAHECTDLTGLDLCGLEKLRILELKCTQITQLSNLNCLGRLEVLEAHGCSGLTSLDLGGLGKLRRLELNGSQNLQRLSNLSQVTCLQILNLEGCTSLMGALDLSSLRELHFLSLYNINSIRGLDSLTQLKVLILVACPQLTTINLTTLHNLEKLSVKYCRSFKELDFAAAYKMQHLMIDECKSFVSLNNFEGLCELTALTLSGTSIEELTIQDMIRLRTVTLSKNSLVKKVQLRQVMVHRFSVSECTNLRECDFGCAKPHAVDLSSCGSLQFLTLDSSMLEQLNITDLSTAIDKESLLGSLSEECNVLDHASHFSNTENALS